MNQRSYNLIKNALEVAGQQLAEYEARLCDLAVHNDARAQFFGITGDATESACVVALIRSAAGLVPSLDGPYGDTVGHLVLLLDSITLLRCYFPRSVRDYVRVDREARKLLLQVRVHGHAGQIDQLRARAEKLAALVVGLADAAAR